MLDRESRIHLCGALTVRISRQAAKQEQLSNAQTPQILRVSNFLVGTHTWVAA